MDIFLYVVLIGLISVLIVLPIFLIRNIMKVKQLKEKVDWLETQEYTTLRIDVPKDNEKMPLSAEQMLASIHGIYSESSLYQNHLSLEIVAKDKFIQFYIYVPKHLKDFVEGQIYAQYPAVEINEVDDYARNIDPTGTNYAICELVLTKPDVYPIKMFTDFEVDPLSGITAVMSKLNQDEQVWFQLIIRPVGDEWQNKGNGIVSSVRAGKKPGGKGVGNVIFGGFKNLLKMILVQAITPGADIAAPEAKPVSLPASVEDALKGIEKKIIKLGYDTKIRVLAIAPDPMTAKVRCQSVAAAFKQYNTTNLNGFKAGEVMMNDLESWAEYCERVIDTGTSILNIEEVASVYHFPHKSVETPNIVWSGAKKGEPPANLPLAENTPSNDITIMGETNFRNVYKKFGIKIDDRKRHMYIIGKSGVGKSVFIENMAVDDVIQGRGIIVVDPHGELADKVLSCVPDERIDDVIVFDPSDRSFPVAFNLLEHVDDDFKGMVASGFVGIFKKIFGDSWGPRLEHILRNTVLALLDFPNSTMLDIPKMLTDNRFRDKVVEKVTDPVIRDFWVNEFAQYDAKFRTEAVSPILNKVGQFLATSTIRNIVGQPKSKINIREIMDQEKILVINLSRGKIGEDNSALLGAMMITKIQLAAMSRADVTVDKRPDCFLYVDEFQNFATDSFAVILAEARKYNLALTMANQFIDQLPDEVRSAVFGNAGTIVSFRVGGADADFLVKEFEPVFNNNDLVNLNKWNIYVKLLIDGVSCPAFSAATLPPVQKLSGNFEKIVEHSRAKYATARSVVETMISGRTREEEAELLAEAEAFRRGGLEALLRKNDAAPENSQEKEVASPEKPVEKPIEVNKKAEITEEKLANNDADNEKNDANTDEENKIAKDNKPRIFKYQNIIGDKLYKEQTARGGVKWFVGEEIDIPKLKETGIEVTDAGIKMMELAKKVAGQGTSHQNLSKNDSTKENQKVETKSDDKDDKPKENSNNKNNLETKKDNTPKGKEKLAESSDEKKQTSHTDHKSDGDNDAEKVGDDNDKNDEIVKNISDVVGEEEPQEKKVISSAAFVIPKVEDIHGEDKLSDDNTDLSSDKVSNEDSKQAQVKTDDEIIANANTNYTVNNNASTSASASSADGKTATEISEGEVVKID